MAKAIPHQTDQIANNNQVPEQNKNKIQKISLTRVDIINAIVNGYGEKTNDDSQNLCATTITNYLQQILDTSQECAEKYNIVILNDETSIVPGDADKIYSAVTKFKNDKPILLILYSNGGYPGSAYLIGKLCLEYSKDNLVISVPRGAKICCNTIMLRG